MRRGFAVWCGALIGLAALVAAISVSARAQEVAEVRLGRAFGIAQLPFMVMENRRLVEQELASMGAKAPKVVWMTLGGGNVLNDALLTGELHFAVGGTTAFLVPWNRTRGTALEIKGVAAMSSTPMLLVTRNPAVRSIADFSAADKIALPAVKVSIQAVTLQMAAAKMFGRGQEFRLDPFTVSLPHPDATAAVISGQSEVNSHFSAPPYSDRELKANGVRLIMNSYDVVGKNTTLNLVYATSKFRDANPVVFRAVLAALKSAIELINKDHATAAQIYLDMTKERSTPQDIVDVLRDPQIVFTVTPINVMKYAQFMHEIGTLKTLPGSWKDLFFDDIHGEPGS